AKAPIYVDETGSITMMEIRSKARRLKSREPSLGRIIVDYLQLMTSGASAVNRVQEVSQISRALKVLARDLDVPIVALSQLSRAVEQRHDKRPILSDLRESGCLSGETDVFLPDEGVYRPIGELVGRGGFRVLAVDTETWRLERRMVTDAFATGTRPVHRLTTRLGHAVRATANHKFLAFDGWRRLDDLGPGIRIAVPRALHAGGSATMLDRRRRSRERAAPAAAVVQSAETAALATSDVHWDEVVSIEPDGSDEVYDLTVDGLHNFVAEDVIVHNSIEQDSDLVMFVYRDEYYNPEETDSAGIAELILAKHRNGATGIEKLAFQKRYAKCADLAAGA